jgi:preprotein translocase subunit YajC
MKKLPLTNKKLLAILTLIVLLVVFSFRTVRAQEVQRTITTNPSVVETMDPGTNKEGTLHIINDSDGTLTFSAETRDFIVVDTVGTPNVIPVGTLDNKYSAAAWIGVAPARFTLKPHEKQEIHYYIQLPFDAKPGGHYAATAYTPSIEKAEGQTGANVNSELGTLFYITVNGQVSENALITKFTAPFSEYGPESISTQIKNFGDLHIRPVGNIIVTNMLGKKEVSALTEQNIFPGGVARDYINVVGKGFMLGRYEAKIAATYGKANDKVLVASVVFWVFPWKITLVLVLIIIAVLLYFKLWRKRKTKKEVTPEDETAN